MRLLETVRRGAAVLGGVCIFAMMLVGIVDVLGLQLLGRALPGAYELTESLMVASVFLALALAQASGRHIRVQILMPYLPPALRSALGRVAHLATAGLLALLAVVGWQAAVESYAVGEFSSGWLRFPVWPARAVLALGAGLMALQALADAVTTRPDPLPARLPEASRGEPRWTR